MPRRLRTWLPLHGPGAFAIGSQFLRKCTSPVFLSLTSGSSVNTTTVMCDKLFYVLAPAVVWLLLGCGSAQAKDPPKDLLASVLNGPVTIDEIFGSNGKLYDEGCQRVECLALDDIAVSFDTMRQRDTPGGQGNLDPQLFNPDVYNDKVKHLLAAHPERHAIYCRILTKIGRHYDAHSEDTTGHWAIEIASLVSLGCARSVVAALPHSSAVDEMLRYGREQCDSYAEPGCRFMVEPRSGGRQPGGHRTQ